MPDELSVRQWQELYRAGAFEKDDDEMRRTAGWNDFNDPLGNRKVQTLAKLVMGVDHPFILERYYVYFVEHRPGQGPRYGSACFHPLEEKWSKGVFSVDLDCPFNRQKWALFTWRYGEGEAEFECGHVRDMLRYIHVMAGELEQGVKPTFWPEKEAAQQYAFEHIPLCGHTIPRREGEHSYSVWDQVTDSRITLHVTRDPGDAPPGFQAQDAVPICGLYVFPQKGIERAEETPAASRKKSYKKKEAER